MREWGMHAPLSFLGDIASARKDDGRGAMFYSLVTLWHERQRYLPGVLAVAFSAVLVALQVGLLLGTFSMVSIPIDHARADLWVGSPEVVSVDVGRAIPLLWQSRLSLPEVEAPEAYVLGFTYWHKPGGGSELCIIIGSRLYDGALGAVRELGPELRARLAEPGAVVVDEADRDRLGLRAGVGEVAEVSRQRVRVVGLVRGLKGLQGPYVFCSLDTARRLLQLSQDQTTYFLARCREPAEAEAVAGRLRREYGNMSAFTSNEFSVRSRLHWLFRTGAGIALGLAALLGLVVGAVVTSQTLYAATVASLREYAVLRALGIPRRRIAGAVLTQSFWVGVAGVLISWPVIYSLAPLAQRLGARLYVPLWLLGFTAAVTLAMALLSGLIALRSLRMVEPAALLR
jgi:putative ABC transport system permease protein